MTRLQNRSSLLSYAQFLKLWERAHPDSTGPTKPPVSAVISKAVYIGRIENNLAWIDATFNVTSLAKSWAELPLLHRRVGPGRLDRSGPAGHGPLPPG